MIDTKIFASVNGELTGIAVDDASKVSDGYHTFEELYNHRIALYIALCKTYEALEIETGHGSGTVWRSQLHSDGTMLDGQFILGINKKLGEQISYHLPLSRWEETDFAQTLDVAPKWDGHTNKDVLKRLAML